MGDFTTGTEREEEEGFEDAMCNKHIDKITHLLKLVELEEEKLFRAMEKAKRRSC